MKDMATVPGSRITKQPQHTAPEMTKRMAI